MKTYDIIFDGRENSNSLGWTATYEECMDYIKRYNGTNESYFADYKGGEVSIYCNESEQVVYSVEIPETIYYIYMHVGDCGGYVATEKDIEVGGYTDADPENFGFKSREEAEETKKALEAYVEDKGLCYTSFTIE